MHALATADTGSLGITARFSLVHDKDTGITLNGGSVEVDHSLTHHGASADDFASGGGELADGMLDDVVIGGTNAHDVVVLRRQFLTGDGEDIFDEGFVLLDSLVDRECGAEVAHHTTHVDGKLATRHLTARNGIDELFLGALRVFNLQGLDDDALELACRLLHLGNSEGFVALDADVGVGDTQSFPEDADADADFLGMLHHDTVVGGEVRLALGGIDDEVLGFLALGDAVFDVGREGGTTKTDDTHLFEFGNNLLRLKGAFAFDIGSTVDGFHPFVSLDSDINGGLGEAKSVLAGIDLQDGTADGGMDIGAHEGLGFADELADLDFVAFLHHGSGRSTEVLVHKHHHLRRHRHHFDGGIVGYLVFFGVDTTHFECLHLFKLKVES